MERDLIKSNQRFYYDGELCPGKLLKKSGEKEINVKKFNAVQIGERYFLLDPNISSEVFLNLQFRNGQYEYLYKSGDKIIVRDENGVEIMPTEWIEKGVKVITPDGIGRVETVGGNVALVKSAEGLKNYYIKNLKYAETTSDLQQYRKGWQIYEQILPQIQQEIKNDNTQLLKGAFMDTFNELDAKMPKKVKEPVVEPVKTPVAEPIKVTPQDATPKVSLVSKIKNAFKKPKDIPAPTIVNEPTVNTPTVNVNHDLAVPPPPAPKATSLDHLGKNYIHVDESNRAGQDNHVLTHIGLNPDTTNDNDKYLYHYEVGSHRDPIATTHYLKPNGEPEDNPPIKGGIYIPGEEVINKTNGERHTVVSHIDFNKDTGALNPVNMLVKDSNGQIKSVPRGDMKLASHDRTKHTIVNTDKGNKHLHDVKEGDIINHEGDKHSVIYSDPHKGLATVNQRSGQMHFTSVNNYHKPYLGQVKPEAKEGQTVQIGKKRYTIEHVSGEEEKGMSILSTTNKLGEKEYFEHPTDKLYDKILKPADLQQYEGDRFDPKAPKSSTEETDPKAYPHADTKDIDSAEDILKLKSTHPNLSDDDIDFLKTGRGLNLSDINKMSPEEVKTILDKRPSTGAKVPDSNPMPETPLPQPVQEQKQKSRLDQIAELHDNAFGEHNKTVNKDSVTHRVGIGDLAIKAGLGGTEILNKEVPIGKNKTAIIHDIDPISKKITFRMKGDDPEDRKKYKTRTIENFKTYVQENEKLDPRADTDVRSRQVAHENDFQNKVYERVAKHLHEKGLEPTKENIDNELNTSNTGLRQSLEQYHKTYEANHNKEKAKGSIVDHPDYEKLDMDKTLSRVPNIEEKVKGELAKIKGSREEQRKKIKESLVDDIAKEYLKNGREYDEKPEVEPTQEDFDMHRKLGGTDQEVHEGVKQRMAELQGQQEYENKVEQGRQALKEGQLKAKLANEEREKMSDKEYLENIYNKKDNIKKSSLNEQVGVQQDKGKLAFNNNPNYHNTEFEYHIVPRNKITTSHTPIQGADSKVPFTPNAEHPASGQGREGYHSENIKGETDRKKVKDIADNPEFDQLINTSRSASEQAPPLIDARGHAINNGRFMAMDITSDENKKGYSEHLKSQLPSLFPNATPEQHEQMRASIDKMTAEGNTPMLTRVPINKTDGEAYDLGKHGEDYGKFASATNEGNIKALGESEKIKAVQNSLTDEDKNKLFSFIPEGRTIGNHIKDVKKADEILDHLQSKGIISDTERSTLYGDDRRLNDKGKKYLSDIYKNAYFDKEGADLLDKNKMIGQKVSDFHSRNSDELNEIKTHSKAYDLQHDIKDAFKSMIADKDQSAGQQKITEDSNVVKGLRYLMEYAGKGKDSEGVEYDDGKDALKKYIESVRKLKEGGGMFEIPEDEKDPKDFKEKYFDKYAKLFDQQKKIEANKQSSGKAQVKNQPKESESKLDIHPAGELIKELQNDDKSVSVENEKPDNPIENKEDNISSEKSVGDISNLPDGRFEVSEPDGGKANFTDESKAKEYSKVLKQQEELKNKFEQDEPNVIYDSKNDLSNHPEAKRYENFPDKKIVTWGQGNYKGIHPDNIMHFNQGGANSRYGRVSFIAPSEHKFKKHAQYKKLAREMRQEGKDVIINAFKNPNIVAKINKMGKSFEPEEQSYWDELRKSFEDPEPKIEEPAQMHLDTPTALPKLANAASGQQHLATLKNNGVPEEELHTTGLHNLLNTDKKIPKADIENHINNKVGKWNKEIVKHPEHQQYSLPGAYTNYREVLHTYENPRKGYSRIDAEDINDKIKNHQQFVPDNYHLGRHLTPEEKTKYRFNEDPSEGSIGFQVYDQDRDERIKLAKEAHKIVKDRMGKEIEKYAKEKNVPLKTVTTKEGNTEYEPVQIEKPWGKGHYRPEGDANIIYHQRFNNRETPEGKKVTHMEEQQSDIHQAGREVGYKSDFKDFDPVKADKEIWDNRRKFHEHPDYRSLLGNTVGYRGTQDQEMKERVDDEGNHKFSDQEKSDLEKYKEIANKYGVKLDENKAGLRGSFSKEEEDKILDAIHESINPGHQNKIDQLAKYKKAVPDVPLKGNKWKEHGFKQALMEAVKDNSDYLSWTTGDQQFKRWGSINVNWTPHKSGEGWNVNIKGRHNDSDLSKDYHVNSLEDVKKLPGEAGSKWSDKIWDRIQKQPEGADYEPLRHGMNKEYSEVLPNIAKKHLKKFGIHPEDIELKLGENNAHEQLDKLMQDYESDLGAQNDYPNYAEVVDKMHNAISSGKSIKQASDELSKQTDSDQEQDIIDDIMVKLTEHEHSLQSHKYVGKEHSATEIKNLGKEIKASNRYSGYVQTILSNKIQQLLTDYLMPPNDDDRSHPFATAVNHALDQAQGDPDIYRLEEIVKMLHPHNQIKPFKKPPTKVHAVKITPELREHILKNGFSMYKSFDEFNEPLQKSLQKPEVPPHDRDETFHLYGNQFMVGNIYNGIKNGTIPHEIQTVKTFNPQDHGIKIYPDIIKENENNPIDNTKPTGLWLKFNYKGEPHNFPIDGSHRMHQLHKNGEPTTNVMVVKDVNAIRKHSDLLMNQNHITPWEDNKLQKSNINYPERIHAMRNRRGENISSIAVMNGDKILMGRRRDSNKWTLPGGHAEEGETAEETGIRELEEETGIKAKKLKSLGSEQVKNPNASELMINCFKYETDEPTSMRDDPDTEVKKWVWVSTPISEDILDNLHAKKNVTLKLLGLQKWEKSFADQLSTAYNNLIKLLKQ